MLVFIILTYATIYIGTPSDPGTYVYNYNIDGIWEIEAGGEQTGRLLYEQLRYAIFLGIFLSLTMMFVLLFLIVRQNLVSLLFAILCLLWFLNLGKELEGFRWPLMSWFTFITRFRMEHTTTPIAVGFTIAIINRLFPGVISKIGRYVVCTVAAVLVLVYLVIDESLMQATVYINFWAILLVAAYLIISFAISLRKVNFEQKILLGGLSGYLFAAIISPVLFIFRGQLFDVGVDLTGIALLAFAFCTAISIFIITMREVEDAKEGERRLTDENAALDSLNRMKAQYLASMSHEIKTPLTVISGDIQRIARLVGDMTAENKDIKIDERIGRSLDRSLEEVMRITRLTESTLRMAAMQEDKEKMKLIDTALLLSNNIEAYRGIIEKQGNVLKIKAEQNLPRIFGNADQIIGAMTNLLTNANRHTKRGEIYVDVKVKAQENEKDEQQIVVTVSDTGTGISPEIMPVVFERGVTGFAKGTGLGLSITKQIIVTHGGEIWIESELGRGTVVTFTIPAYSDEGAESGNV